MWPFKSKQLDFPHSELSKQIDLHLKSMRLPQANPRWKLFARRNKFKVDNAITEGYETSAIAYTCIEKRAKLIASVPWVAYEKTADGWQARPESKLQRLIDSPNDHQSWYEFMYELSQQLDLSGNGFISEVKTNLPRELWVLQSQYMKIKPGSERMIDSYTFDNGAYSQIIDADDMTHIKMPSPSSQFWGMPPIMAAGKGVDIDREAGDFQKVSFQNRGLSDLAIKLPDNATPEQANTVMEKLKERFLSPKNARKPIVSSGEVRQLNQTAQEMDFINSRKAVWTEVAAVFGLSLANLGFVEDVNLANAESMNRAMWENTIIPQLELIKRQLTHQLAREFGENWKLEPDLANVKALQDSEDKRLERAERAMNLGYTRDEVNERYELGFEAQTEGGDVRYEPTGRMPIIPFSDNQQTTTQEQNKMLKALGYGE